MAQPAVCVGLRATCEDEPSKQVKRTKSMKGRANDIENHANKKVTQVFRNFLFLSSTRRRAYIYKLVSAGLGTEADTESTSTLSGARVT